MLTLLISMTSLITYAHDIAVPNVDGKTIYYVFINDKTELAVSFQGNDINYYPYPNRYVGDLDIPESVSYNGNNYSVTRIGWRSFEGCTGLTSITIPNSVIGIDDRAFFGCTGITSITVPNSVTSIGWLAFRECSNLSAVSISNNVNFIGDYAFRSCYSLTSIKIPDNVTSISDYTFQDCTSLTSVEIPVGVTKIGNYAFSGCKELSHFYCHSDLVPNTESTAFSNSSIMSATLYIPNRSIHLYRTSSPWDKYGSFAGLYGNIYTLSYVIDNNEYKSYGVWEEEKITPEDEPTKEGHTFNGWSEIPEWMPPHNVTVAGSFTVNTYKLI